MHAGIIVGLGHNSEQQPFSQVWLLLLTSLLMKQTTRTQLSVQAHLRIALTVANLHLAQDRYVVDS